MIKKALLLTVLLGLVSFKTTSQCFADVSTQFEQAEEYEDDEKYEQAAAIYKSIAKDHAGTEDGLRAQQELVYLYIESGRTTEAEAAYQELLARYSNHDGIAKVVDHVGDKYRQSEEYDKARKLYQYVVATWPDAEHAVWSQASVVRSSILLGDESAVQAALEKLIADFRDHKDVAKAVGEIADEYDDLDKYQRVLQLHKRIVDTWPQSDQALESQVAIVKIQIGLRGETAAQAAFDRLVSQFREHKDIAKAINDIAEEYHDEGNDVKARELYQYAVDNFSHAEHAVESQAVLVKWAIKDGNKSAAEAGFDKLVSQFGEHKGIAEAIHHIANEYQKLGRHEKAIPLYQHVIDNWPRAEHAMWSHKDLACLNIVLGNFDAVDGVADKLIADFSGNPRLPRALQRIGTKCDGAREFGKAKSIFQQLVQVNPDGHYGGKAKLYIARINILSLARSAKEDEVKAAIDKLATDFKDHRELPKQVFLIAEEYFHRADYKAAIKLWKRVARDYPEDDVNSKIPFLLGMCYEQLEDYPKAIECYKKVVEKYPDSYYAPQVPYKLGMRYRELKAYEQAVYWLGKQHELYSGEPISRAALFWQGMVYLFDMEDYQKAADTFQEYFESYPDTEETPWALYNLATCLERTGHDAQATAILTMAQKTYPDSQYADEIKDKLTQLQEGVEQ